MIVFCWLSLGYVLVYYVMFCLGVFWYLSCSLQYEHYKYDMFDMCCIVLLTVAMLHFVVDDI